MLCGPQLRAHRHGVVVAVLLAVGLPVLALCQGLQVPLTLDIGAPGDQLFLRGFLPAILGERVNYRWSSPDAELRLHGWVSHGARITLRLDGGPGAATRRLLLVEPRNGTQLASVDVSGGWHAYALEIPPGTWHHAGVLRPARIGLRADHYRTAADGGALGFKLDSARVERLSVDWPIALARAAMLTWLLGLASVIGLWFVARLPVRLQAWAPLTIAAALAVAIGTLSLCLLRRPLLTAWTLPPLPVTCSALTLALVGLRLRLQLARVRRQLARFASARATLAAALAALAALGLLYVRVSAWWAVALASTTVLFLLFLAASRESQGDQPDSGATPSAHIASPTLVVSALLVLVVALGLRFYRITELPFGLWRDEARHGLAALRILEDPRYRPVFLPAADIPAGGAYAFVPAFLLFGIHTWTMRTVTALAGALTVIPLAFVARRLTGQWPTALLAAGLLAASTWHLTVSRLSFMSVFHPLCELSALAVCGHALDTQRTRLARMLWLIVAGALFGLATYTYHSGRLAPLIGLIFVLCFSGAPLLSRRTLTALAAVVLACAAVVTPLWLYMRHAPQVANARIERVSLLSNALSSGSAPLAALDASIARHLLMFHVRGDTIGRHNLPGQPEFDPIAGLGLLAGLFVLGRRPRDTTTLFLAAVILLAIAPSLFSVDGPRVTRAFDTLPYVCIVAALGWSVLLVPACCRWHQRGWLPSGLTLAAAACAFWSYFVAAPREEAVWRSFYPVETKTGEYLRALAERRDGAALAVTYLPATLARQEVTQYLAHGLRFGVCDDNGFWPSPSGSFRVLLPTGTNPDTVTRLAETTGHHLDATLPGALLPDGTTPAFTVLVFR